MNPRMRKVNHEDYHSFSQPRGLGAISEQNTSTQRFRRSQVILSQGTVSSKLQDSTRSKSPIACNYLQNTPPCETDGGRTIGLIVSR